MEKSRRWWLACCGLDCGQCSIHLRTNEELDYWQQKSVDLNLIRCDGCRSAREGHHWSPECKILACCLDERGLDFCAQCSDFPCPIIEDFVEGVEHHARAVETLRKMKQTGVEIWLAEHGYS